MANEKTDKPTSREERERKAAERRAFIRKKVIDSRKTVSFDTLIEEYGVSSQALYKDGDYFRENEVPIAVKAKQFHYQEDHLRTVSRRGLKDVPEKVAIARIASTLILSPPRDEFDEFDDRLLPDQPAQGDAPFTMSYDLKTKLRAYMNKAHRMAILDSGSTTAEIARQIAKVKTPSPSRHLASLRVLTNGRTVVEQVDIPSCNHDVILLGGALRKDTEAVAGLLAERCLDAWALSTSESAFADISIIGTTNVNDDYDLFCDHELEAAIKSRLLNSGRIRCIAATASKLIGRHGGSWSFCPFSSQFIDVIVTDSQIVTKQKNEKDERARKRFVERAREAGIYVAVGATRADQA